MSTTIDQEKKRIFAKRFKQIRTTLAKATQSEFAEILGISRIYVSQLENPDSPKYPSDSLLRRISDLYEINYLYLTKEPSENYNLGIEYDLIQEKMNTESLFVSDENTSSMGIFAKNYYKLLSEQLAECLSPEELDKKSYESYLYTVIDLYKLLFQAMDKCKTNIDEDLSPILNAYLRKVEENINAHHKKEGISNEVNKRTD